MDRAIWNSGKERIARKNRMELLRMRYSCSIRREICIRSNTLAESRAGGWRGAKRAAMYSYFLFGKHSCPFWPRRSARRQTRAGLSGSEFFIFFSCLCFCYVCTLFCTRFCIFFSLLPLYGYNREATSTCSNGETT